MRRERGQAAMEFLMTYGWAILVVVIVLGIIAFYGIFKSANSTPDLAVTNPPFYGKGVSIQNAPGSPGEVDVELTNQGEADYTVTNVDASGCGSLNGNFIISTKSSRVFIIPCDDTSAIANTAIGKSVKGTLTIRYIKPGSSLTLLSPGYYFSRVQQGISPILNVLFAGTTPANGSTQTNTSIPVALSTYSSGSLDRYAFVDFDRSLVGWWRMDYYDENNLIVYDNSTYSNNGSGIDLGAEGVSGKFGLGASMAASRVSLGALGQRLSLNLTGAMTFATWVYANPDFGTPLLSGGTGQLGETLYYITLDTLTSGDPDLRVRRANSQGNIVDLTFTKPLAVQQWQHIAVTIDNNSPHNLRYYINGIDVAGTTYAGVASQDPATQIYIGSSPTQLFNGYMDEVLIFNRSLSAGEIASLYSARANSYSNVFNVSSGKHIFIGHTIDTIGNNKDTALRTVTII